MKKLGIAILVVILAGLIGTTMAIASTENRTPDATIPQNSLLNEASYWGEGCIKYDDDVWEPRATNIGYMPAGYSLLVLKAGQFNFVWYNPAEGNYGTPTLQNISHSIVCRGEVHEPEITYDTWHTVDCEGVYYYGSVSVDGEVTVEPFLLNFYAWTKPYELEITPAYTGAFNVGYDAMRFSFSRVPEPERCLQHEPEFFQVSDCEGWRIVMWDGEQRTIVDSGTWQDFTTNESFFHEKYELRVIEPQDCFTVCEETYVSEWTPFEGDGKDKTSFREYRDIYTNEVCNTEYREKCISDKVVHFWTDGWCMFRDRTYPENASWMVNPPVFMQMAYCGCDYTPFGEWGIVEVNECDGDGYKYWSELTPYCGFTNCE
jgi:hypothetical protein